MNVRIDKTFEKDVIKIKNNDLLNKIAKSIVNVQSAANLKDIKSIKKLKGTRDQYRIRIGEYRLGIIISKDVVIFIRCLHRKDIYHYFPK